MRARRGSVYKAPPPSRFRRILRFFINGWTISITLIGLLAAFLTLTYFWFEFSDRIDRKLLSGDVFTQSAGIYSAAKTIRVDEASSAESLIQYLKSAGYIERNDRADKTRSRYWIENDVLNIEPGVTGTIDGQKVFPALAVRFKKDGRSVAALTDKDVGAEVKESRLEPKLLSSIAAEGDGRRRSVSFSDLPPHLIKAITVTEDRAFFEHYGVNLRGIARALWRR